MDTSRLSRGETIAAVSGLALFLFMFLGWFDYDQSEGLVAEGPFSAWQWMSFLDILLFLAAVATIAVAVARARGATSADLPATPGQILVAAGGLALLIVVFRLLFPGDGPLAGGDLVDHTRKFGAFLGLIAAGGMTYGGYLALNEPAPSPPRRRAATSPPPP